MIATLIVSAQDSFCIALHHLFGYGTFAFCLVSSFGPLAFSLIVVPIFVGALLESSLTLGRFVFLIQVEGLALLLALFRAENPPLPFAQGLFLLLVFFVPWVLWLPIGSLPVCGSSM